MKYVYAKELADLRERGQKQAKWALEEAAKLVELLHQNPDLPFVGNAFVDDWHSQDGSVVPECTRVERVALGLSPKGRDKQLQFYRENASLEEMRHVLAWTMRDLKEGALETASEDEIRDWYENGIPWTNAVYCQFD